MDALTAIDTRVSAKRLEDPGPTREQLDTILRAGGRAPDHGRMAPWRFVVIEGESRAILGKAMADLYRRRAPQAPAAELEQEAGKAMRAPTIVVVAARIKPSPKVPDIEQTVAVGAAVQNMFLAAHALGLGAMWKTGAPAYDSAVKSALGLEPDDQIVAFLYLGAPAGLSPRQDSAVEPLVTRL